MRVALSISPAAFTLIELIAVLALTALLAGITLPALRAQKERAALLQARAELSSLALALDDYRRIYGDYPRTGDFAEASPDPAAEPLAPTHAQVRLFAALSGRAGPSATGSAGGMDEPSLLDPGKFNLEFHGAGRISPSETETCILDPWGRRYLYFYKSAAHPSDWQADGYRLFSAGPDGRYAPHDSAGWATAAVSAEDADNVGSSTYPGGGRAE